MASINKVILIGNLGRDPELRYTQGGSAVTNFTLATNEKWKDKDGNNQERTEWHRIVVWGRSAENCAQYLQKGSSVFIEGRLQTREWEDKEGNKRQTTEINAASVQFLSGRGNGGGAGGPGGGGPSGGDPGGGGSGGGGPSGGNPGGGGSGGGNPGPCPAGDDIPF
jgi:single-strand DNA-binding protein